MALQGFILVGPTSSRDAELPKKPKGAQSNAPVRTAPYTPTSNTGKKGDPQNSPGGYSLALGLTIEKKNSWLSICSLLYIQQQGFSC